MTKKKPVTNTCSWCGKSYDGHIIYLRDGERDRHFCTAPCLFHLHEIRAKERRRERDERAGR